MKIQHYSFGEIMVNGRRFDNDVIITPEDIFDWWRDEGHVVKEKDLTKVFEVMPDVLVIGTGHEGEMKVPDGCQDDMDSHGIDLVIEKTSEAVDTFNDLIDEGKKVVGAFHLTC